MAHTPGPWIHDIDEDWIVADYDGDIYTICELSGYPLEHREGNAKLILSAPDLLMACQAQAEAENHHRICENCYDGTLCEMGQTLYENARSLRKSALAKAGG